MTLDLKVFLCEYSNLTKELLENLYEDNIEQFEKIVIKRQNLINSLGGNYSKQEFQKLALEMNLQELEKKVEDLASLKLQEYKKNMAEVCKGREAQKAYNENARRVSLFTKKI